MAESDTKTESKINSDSDEDGNEILEESPCGRWQKRKEKVTQRDIPGIDIAYLAMDNELGVEVVWNEVQFSERKNFRAQEEKIKSVFDNLMQLDHVNLVKFHKYWMDPNPEKPRVIFITEYMSSGSMSNFLKRTRKSSKTLSEKVWKKWCTQILNALNYLHSCEPAIVHGNLTCNTIFIQHNGLIKIGCVAPDAIHQHVKTFRENVKNMHYVAPETTTTISTAIDIYAFGICALEMAVLGFQMNGDSSGTAVTQELIEKTIQSLEDPVQIDFILLCLKTDPSERPTAKELLFHQVLFEVHSLKLLAAHVVVNSRKFDVTDDDVRMKEEDKQKIMAEVVHEDGRPPKTFRYSEVSALELDKLLEDVRNGIYPLTAFALCFQRPLSNWSSAGGAHHSTPDSRVLSPSDQMCALSTGSGGLSNDHHGGSHSPANEEAAEVCIENRRIVNMGAEIKATGTTSDAVMSGPNGSTPLFTIILMLKMDDKMNRQLTADIFDTDTPEILADELVGLGFINEEDKNDVMNLIATTVLKCKLEMSTTTNNNTANQNGPSNPNE